MQVLKHVREDAHRSSRVPRTGGAQRQCAAAVPQMRVPGTTTVVNTMQPSPTFLLSMRGLLRRGGVVGRMPDRSEERTGRTQEFDTPNGPLIVAPAILHVAALVGARVIFTEVHVEGRSLVGTVRVASSDTAEGLTREFVEFVCARAEAGAAVFRRSRTQVATS